MSRRKTLMLITIFLSGLISHAYAQQDKPTIQKGQLLPAPKIVRSAVAEKFAGGLTSTIFEEDFETGGTSWSISGSWAVGSPTSGPYGGHNSTNCAATDLSGYYPNDADDWLISPSISLPALTYPSSRLTLSFWEWFEIESGYDYGKVKISTDGGSTWSEVDSRSGSSDWRQTTIDLSSYAGQTIKVGFHFTSDYSVTYAGWYIDDVQIILEEPQPLRATLVSLNHQNFPFIYMNVAVDTFGVGFPDLTQSNFQVYENGVLQTDYFEVTPPEAGGGVRLADIVFLMDNSGSMEDEHNAVRNNVIDFVNNLTASGVDFALGLCRFGASENSGYPIIEDNGILTSDAEYFKNDVWNRNVISGGFEPGWDALYEAATGFNFRPGAQKIFILITDECVTHPGDTNYGRRTYDQALNILQLNSITLFALIDLNYTNSIEDYGTIAEATNGKYFDIYSPFDEILDYISSQVASTYLIRYKSSNPVFDGTLRHVEVRVSYAGNVATCEGSYVPGSAPAIQRTQATLDLHNRPWAEGTEFTIEAEIVDNVAPYVQEATLYYRTTGAASYSSTPMNPYSGDIYRGTIPGSAVHTPGLDYYITATDGQTTSSDPSVDPVNNPYQIAILPNVAPVITHTPVTTLTPGIPITITAEIVDNTNYVASAKIYYRKTGQLIYQSEDMTNIFGDTYEAQIPSNYVTIDGVDYYIFARDDLGVGNYSGTPDNPYQIEPEYDLGFRPNPHGWQFGNTEDNMWPEDWWSQFNYSQDPFLDPHDPLYINSSRRFPDWFLFVDAFGHGQCYFPGGIPRLSAYSLWKAISRPKFVLFPPHFEYWPGSCFGFAISAFLFYDRLLSINDIFPEKTNLFDVPITDDSRKLINMYWIYQFGRDQLDYIKSNKSKTPVQTLNKLKQMLLSEAGRHRILVFYNQRGSGAHAVNPYKVERSSLDPSIYYIYVYDNNHPNEQCKIQINTEDNNWYYDKMPKWGGKKGLFLMDPIANYMNIPILPPKEEYISLRNPGDRYLEIYNTPGCNTTIVDSFGRSIGYHFEDDSLFCEIDDAIHIIPITGFDHPPIGYYLPSGSYSIHMTSFVDTAMYFSVFSDSSAFHYTRRNVTQSQTDNIVYTSSGNSFKLFNSDTQPKNFDLQSIIIESDNEKVFTVENCTISQDDSLAFDIVNRENLEISNKGQDKSYNLRVRLTAANTDIIFEHKGIAMSSYSSHRISPDWVDLKNQPVPILIDENMDGTIDDTLLVKNQYIGATPPTGGVLSNASVYCYPNPFNPNIEVCTIRFSLSRSGNVTIKIYDVSNTLVTTVISDLPMEANTEQAVQWDGRNDQGDIVANGVYFYRITTSAGEEATGKVAVLR